MLSVSILALGSLEASGLLFIRPYQTLTKLNNTFQEVYLMVMRMLGQMQRLEVNRMRKKKKKEMGGGCRDDPGGGVHLLFQHGETEFASLAPR